MFRDFWSQGIDDRPRLHDMLWSGTGEASAISIRIELTKRSGR
jgi:hypothetical protein